MAQSLIKHKILIVEDDRSKAKALRECAVAAGVLEEAITLTETITVAAQLIDNQDFNGIILDLAFHSSQESSQIVSKRYLAGINILQQLEEMQKTTPVIVATQHKSFESPKFEEIKTVDDLRRQLAESFDTTFKGLVEVDLRELGWRSELIMLIRRWFFG
jgi:DNA-binding NtrC family response regulator